jgi:tetratricopeptide (TPR) repeat protein
MIKKLFILILIFQTQNTFSQSDSAQFELALDYYKQENYDKAIKIYTPLIYDGSKYIYGSLLNRALCYEALKQYEYAIKDIKQANTFYQTDSNLFQIALNYEALYNYRESLKYFKKAKDKGYPNTYELAIAIGTEHYFINEIDSAKKYLLTAYEINPKDGGLLTNLGFSFENSNPEKSCSFFKEAYDLDNNSSLNTNNLGYSYYLCSNLDSAFKYFELAKFIDSENSYVYRNLGLLFKKQSNKESACLNYNIALEKDFIRKYGIVAIEELSQYCRE